ncbi:hypothetical protein QVD17_32420 [Tagetes erecta]|uniref:DUF4283 domain-containing protein n=1 Tax=Tagetes erecta TaxID=13708 RepID=A0AAD8JXT4_TARER|nr:hypothetical protein QVD17_32420 [Tagetes erecta]
MSDSSKSVEDFSNFHLDPGDPLPPDIASASIQLPSVDLSSSMDCSIPKSAEIVGDFHQSSSLGVSRSIDPVSGRMIINLGKERGLQTLLNCDVDEAIPDVNQATIASKLTDDPLKGVLGVSGSGKSALPEFVDSEEIEAAMNAFVSRSCIDPEFVKSAKAFISLHILCPEFESKYGKMLRSMGSKELAFKRKCSLDVNLIDGNENNVEKKGRETEILEKEHEGSFGVLKKGYEAIKVLQAKIVKDGVNATEMKFVKEAAKQGKQFKEEKFSLPMLWPKFNMGNGIDKERVPPAMVIDKLVKKGCTSFKQVKKEVAKEKKLTVMNVDKALAENAKSLGSKQVDLCSIPIPINAKFVAEKKDGPGHTSYVGAVKGKEKPVLKDPIEYCPPVVLENGERVAVIKQEFLEKAEGVYKTMLYGYFVGANVDLQFVRFNLYKMWRKFGIVDISTNGLGIFFFKFRNEEGLKAVMNAGPWVVNNIPLCIFKWEMGMNVVREEPEKIPMWVTLKNLPLELWNTKCICQIVSCIGKPLTFDYITTDKCAKLNGVAGFARVLVEVSAKNELPEYVKTVYPAIGEIMGGSLNILVEYQQHPARCSHCCVFGHSLDNCKVKPGVESRGVSNDTVTDNGVDNTDVEDKGKSKMDSDGFEYVGSKNKGGRQQGRNYNGGQQNRRPIQGGYRNGGVGRIMRNGNQQWRRSGESGNDGSVTRNAVISKQTNIKAEDLKHQSNGVSGETSSKSQSNKDKGIGGERMRMANRFEVLSVDEGSSDNKEDQEAVKDGSFDNVNRASAEKKKDKNKMLPPVRTIFTRQVAAAEKLKTDQGTTSDGGISKKNSVGKDSKSGPLFEKVNPFEVDLHRVARILNRNNPKLLKAQEVEIIDMIIKKQIPSKKVLESWSKFQRKFYLQMCDSTNFFKGLNAVVELCEEFDNEVEVDSDNEQAAQDMKVDEVSIGNGADSLQDTQVLGAASSSKSV